MAIIENFDLFFADFGANALIGAATVKGIFGNEFYEADGYNGSVETVKPAFHCKTSDVSTVTHGANAVINSITYKVRGIRPDGSGITTLILEKQ